MVSEWKSLVYENYNYFDFFVHSQLEMLQNSAGACWYNKTNEQMVEGTGPAQGIKCKAFEI